MSEHQIPDDLTEQYELNKSWLTLLLRADSNQKAERIAALEQQLAEANARLEGTAVTGQSDMVLVPRIPTAEMLKAGWYAAHDESAAGVWRDMIEAWELSADKGRREPPSALSLRSENPVTP